MRFVFLLKINMFTADGQIRSTLQEVGVSVSKSSTMKRLRQSKHLEALVQDKKLLVRLKIRKICLEFARNIFHAVLEQLLMDRWDGTNRTTLSDGGGVCGIVKCSETTQDQNKEKFSAMTKSVT